MTGQNSHCEADCLSVLSVQILGLISLVSAGRDLIGRARTGSGKTLAFALPVIEKLMARPGRRRAPGCIVLAPTRELAKQVEREFAATGPMLKTACVYGGRCSANPVASNSMSCSDCGGCGHLLCIVLAPTVKFVVAAPIQDCLCLWR